MGGFPRASVCGFSTYNVFITLPVTNVRDGITLKNIFMIVIFFFVVVVVVVVVVVMVISIIVIFSINIIISYSSRPIIITVIIIINTYVKFLGDLFVCCRYSIPSGKGGLWLGSGEGWGVGGGGLDNFNCAQGRR